MSDVQAKVNHVRSRIKRLSLTNSENGKRLGQLDAESQNLSQAQKNLQREHARAEALRADLILRICHAKLHLEALMNAKGRLQQEVASAKKQVHGDIFEMKLVALSKSKLEAAAIQRRNEQKSDEERTMRNEQDADVARRATNEKETLLASVKQSQDEQQVALTHMEEQLAIMKKLVDDTLGANVLPKYPK